LSDAVYSSLANLGIETQERLLAQATLKLEGLIPWSSNYTFLASAEALAHASDLEAHRFLVIYKPCRGERPLWDFATGNAERGSLSHREVASYAVSRQLGWPRIPPVVFRDGPHGPGSVQLFVEADPEAHYFTLRDEPGYADAFRRIALFDYVVNNADRKGGHVLLGTNGDIWAIDHGLTFHVEHKLRTVIWEYAGQPISQALLDDLARAYAALRNGESRLRARLEELIEPAEVRALGHRIRRLLREGAMPWPHPQWRNVPYPLV